MITSEAICIFDEYRGGVERCVAATGQAPDLQAWTLINLLIGDMILLKNGFATTRLAWKIKAGIYDVIAGEEVFILLETIAERKIRANSLDG